MSEEEDVVGVEQNRAERSGMVLFYFVKHAIRIMKMSEGDGMASLP